MMRVVFRTFKEGDVIALFPDERNRGLVLDYMHIGQHGESDYNAVVRMTKLSTYEEYAPLLQELKSIGYDNLKVYKKAMMR